MEIIGYYFSFKDSRKNEDGSFSVFFKSGVSDEYPFKYRDKKDFYCLQVKRGDFSSLYMDAKQAEDVFNNALGETEDDFFKENWAREYSHSITWEEWKWCWAISGVEFEACLSHMNIDDEVYEKLGVTEETKALYVKYRLMAEEEYDKSLESIC